ncbi:MAG: tetraacyldisaccharide 4'-kinase [Bacteroidales bacterium]|nr:tetraacyldisaccharide 4'-kinase [Bacteroidales bacterium]
MPFIENHACLLRVLAAPFTPFYALATAVRNRLYDSGRLSSSGFPFPLICVGNLCAGGSGKTPMTEYLVRLLSDICHVGVVSRGYGRKTQENLLASESMTARQTGDEPMQYLQKFARLPQGFSLYLAADRRRGIHELKALEPNCGVIILDDAYQHRSVRAGLNILLTEYQKPYFRDFPLPLGTLRESRKGARRAQIIVATKCPDTLSQAQRDAFIKKCKPLPGQQVFFCRTAYEEIRPVNTYRAFSSKDEAVLFTGIAHPEPIERHLQEKGIAMRRHLRFGDHHAYTQDDLARLVRACRQTGQETACLLTTEKDWARLAGHPYLGLLADIPLYVLPVRTEFLFGQGEAFNRRIREYVQAQE